MIKTLFRKTKLGKFKQWMAVILALTLIVGLLPINKLNTVYGANVEKVPDDSLELIRSVSQININLSTYVRHEWGNGVNGRLSIGDNGRYVFSVPMSSYSGFVCSSPLKVYFENVMAINGRAINAVMSIDSLTVSAPYASTKKADGYISFLTLHPKTIWIGLDSALEYGVIKACDNIQVTMSFSYADTNEPTDIDMYQVIKDVDIVRSNPAYSEAWQGISGYSGNIFVFDSCILNVDAANTKLISTAKTASSDTEAFLKAGAIIPIKGSTTTQVYTESYAAAGMFLYSPYDGNNLPAPEKTADTAKIYEPGDEIVWSITQDVHTWQRNIFSYYDSMSFEDKLPKNVSFVSAQLYDDGIDVTSKYGEVSYDRNSHKVKYTLNSNILRNSAFYDGGRLELKITTNAINNGETVLSAINSASTEMDGVVQYTSNVEATINPLFEIKTSIKNGKITESQKNISMGGNSVISWSANEGYYIDSVMVDGKGVSVGNTSYTFSNINANHTVDVVCKPYFKVETSIDNGVITRSDKLIKAGESREISWAADDGYYVTKVVVDGITHYEGARSEGYLQKYTFSNIMADHKIDVTTALIPSLSISKESDKNIYNCDDEIIYTIKVKQDIDGAVATNVVIADKEHPQGLILDLSSVSCSDSTAAISTDENSNSFEVLLDRLEYGKTVIVTVKGTIDKGSITSSDLRNIATVTSDQTGTVQDEKDTTIYYEVLTEVIDGAITKSDNLLTNGSNKTIIYTANDGYYLDKIEIDGIPVDIEQFKDNYVFKNINDNHKIKVTYLPYHKVATEIDHGTITDSKMDIKSGEDCSITWEADDGYYVSKVIVDDEVVYNGTVLDYPTSYTFTNIQEDHSVSVETKLIPNITISKISDKETYNCLEDILYTINVSQTIEGAVANNVIISDVDFTDGLVLDSASIDCNNDAAIVVANEESGNFIITIEELKYGEDVVVTIKGRVDNSVINTSDIFNKVEVTSDQTRLVTSICNNVIYYTVETNAVNGTITESDCNIRHGDDKIITYIPNDGYYLSKVEVDGEDIDIEKYADGYVFEKINSNHIIKVEFTKYNQVVTEIDHGTITASKYDIKCGENYEVAWRPDEGYYVSKVVVDGEELYNGTTLDYMTDYTFSDITSDHKIIVETEPIPALTIKKTSDKESYNYPEILQYTIEVEQTVEDAMANNVVILDSVSSKGLILDLESIVCNREDAVIEKDENANAFSVSLNSLEFGEKVLITVCGSVNSDELESSELANTAWADSDQTEPISNTINNKMYYSVVTEIDCGIITESKMDIEVGGNYNISWSTDEDRYVSEVYVDGELIYSGTTLDYLTNYDFSNINDNHSVKVETKLIPHLSIIKESDKASYNYTNTIEYKIIVEQTIEGAVANNVVIMDKDSKGIALDLESVVCNIDNAVIKTDTTNGSFYVILEELEYGERIEINVKASVDNDELESSEIKNTAVVSSDQTKDIFDEQDSIVLYSVITEVYNGKITESDHTLTYGSKKTILYDANEDYYLASVTLDGEKVDIEEYSNGITLSNIKSNHEVVVVYEKMPTLDIVKTSDKNVYDFGDTIHYTVSVTETDENAVAKNIVIADETHSKGLKIKHDSIVIAGTENYTIVTTDLGFYVVVSELKYGDKIIVSYDATMESDELAGTTVSNTATAICDNIKEGNPVSATSKADINQKPTAPQTGDDSNILLYIAGLVVSGVALIDLLITKKKRWLR